MKALQGTVLVKGDVQAKAQVSSIDTPVTVQGDVSVQDKVTIDGKVHGGWKCGRQGEANDSAPQVRTSTTFRQRHPSQ